jgi:iron complex outermembrane receptor protein
MLFLLGQAWSLRAQYALEDTIPIREVLILVNANFGDYSAGAVVQRVDTLEMMNKISSSLSELLAEHTPVFIKSNGRGALATASMRGAGASHTTVLWNNIPINSPLTGQVDFSLIPVYFTDQMDLYFGSSSLQLNGGALGGTIALSNTPNWNQKFSATAMQSIGEFGTYATFGQMNYSQGDWSFSTRSFYETSENNFNYYLPGNRNTETAGYRQLKNANYKKAGNLTELYYRLNEQMVAGAKIWYQNSHRNIPALIGSSVYNHEEIQQDENLKIQGFLKHYGDKFSWESQLAFIADGLNYALRNQPTDSSAIFTHFESENTTRTGFANLMGTYKLPCQWKFELQLQAKLDKAHVYDTITQIGFDPEQTTLSAMVSANKAFGERWYFSALLRDYRIDKQWMTPMPSVGAEFLLSKLWNIKLKARAATNYHYPTINDLYYVPGGNPDLQPEKSNTFDLSLMQQWAKNQLEFSQSLNGYASIITNWIQWTPSDYGYWEPSNVKKVYSRGFEYQAKVGYVWKDLKASFRIQYAYSPTSNESDNLSENDGAKGQQLIYIPKNSGSGTVFLHYKKFSIDWLTCFLGQRHTATVADDELFPQSAYWLSKVSAGYAFTFQNWELGFRGRIDNLFDVSYQNITDRPMPYRNYSLLVKITFK